MASFGSFNIDLGGLQSRHGVKVVGLIVDVGMGISDGGSSLDPVLVGTLNGFPSPSVDFNFLTPRPTTGSHTISLNGRNGTRPLSLYARRGSIALIGIGIVCDEADPVQRVLSAGSGSLACRVEVGHLVCVFEYR